MIDIIKLLIYQEQASLLEKLDFEDDTIFLEPLLFTYFNSKKYMPFPKEILEEIMQGYFITREPLQIKHSYNKNNIAYIPKIGYFEKNSPTPIASILEVEGLEVVKELHPLMHRYLFESYKGEITNPNPEYNSVWSKHKNTLSQALFILKNQVPNFYKDFLEANKKIFIHDNPKILNFTSKETLGMLFFYATPKATLMYFIEELIHQGAHNILYHITFNEKEYFKIDARNTLMSILLPIL